MWTSREEAARRGRLMIERLANHDGEDFSKHSLLPTRAKFIDVLYYGAQNDAPQADNKASAMRRGVRYELEVTEAVQNLGGNLHGGCTATILDMITTYAIYAHVNEPRTSVSTNLSVEYIAGAAVGKKLYVDGWVDKVGRTLVFTSVDIYEKNEETNLPGILIARGSHTKCFLPSVARL